MTQDGAFLQAIIENPDDDAPRLIYADYLEENGQGERAAFLRIQCELARLSEEDPRRADLESKAQHLLVASLAKSKVAFHPEQDAWHGPTQCVWDVWSWVEAGFWPCGYAQATAGGLGRKLMVY